MASWAKEARRRPSASRRSPRPKPRPAVRTGLCWRSSNHWSVRIGRRRTIALACTLALVSLPLGLWSATAPLLALGAFLMQAGVQGAWAMVPAHLNELSPPAARAMFPGFVYQLGNLLSSYVVASQAQIAQSRGDDYAFAIGVYAVAVAIGLALWANLGPERSTEELRRA